VQQVIVTGPRAPVISNLEDLSGKEVYANPLTDYYENLQKLSHSFQQDGRPGIRIKTADANLTDEDLLEMVNAGLIPATVTINIRAEFWSRVLPHLTAHQDITLKSEGELACPTRKDSPQLNGLLDEFLKGRQMGTSFGNTLVRRYLENKTWVQDATSNEEMKKFQLYVSYFKKYAAEYDFDYLLLVAQGYQESHLDQSQRNPSGAVGIMQVIPKYAAASPIDISNVDIAENNIEAGAKMLHNISQTYFNDEQLDALNRTLMTFAAYNAGPIRIVRLRKHAASEGLDPNRWFGNVELMAAKEIGQDRNGPVHQQCVQILPRLQTDIAGSEDEAVRESCDAIGQIGLAARLAEIKEKDFQAVTFLRKRRTRMLHERFHNIKFAIGLVLTVLTLCGIAVAQNQDLKGVINGRSGATMTVLTQDSETIKVLLTADTQVLEPEGVFRKKHLAMTALVPGLSVDVKGSMNAQNQLVADTVTFHGSDLKTAQDIQAGLTPTETQVQQNQKQIQEQEQQIQQQKQELTAEQKASAEHAAEIAKNKAAIAAANKRFGELGEYNILGEVTVLFGNGKVAIEDQYKPQLLKLAQQAMGITGYVILVKGYASKVGSAALNEKLSAERAENVTDFLEQQGKIPLTNMLAPGAMGTSRQVAPDTTAEGQAENRRVVVRILQNKGIAGT
jgi:outer membrane protein OmpA-like peptidoglycan-associated protein